MIYLVQLAEVKLQKLHCISLKFPVLINYNQDLTQVGVQ